MFEQLQSSKVMLCNVIYQPPSKKTGWKNDFITMVYRDLITNEKKLFTIKDPTYVVYVVKEEYRNFDDDNPRHSLPFDACEPYEIRYADRFRFIAEVSGNQQFLRTHKGYELRELYRYAYIHGADIPIEVYYRVLWDAELSNDLPKRPDACYLDIEVDTSEWTGVDPVPKDGECPINAISVTDGPTNITYQFLLKEKDNPLIDPFLEPDHLTEVKEEFHKMYDDPHRDTDNGNPVWKMYMFDSEIELIESCFTLIHSLKRDFCGVFNMDFDIPYIQRRYERYRRDPRDLFCHPDFPDRTYYYRKDVHQFDFEKRRSYCEASCYTYFIDLMYLYVGTRRSKGAIRQISLDAIAEREELGVQKLDYESHGIQMKYFSRTNYDLFVLYGANDTMLLKKLDEKTHDLEIYYGTCLRSFCQYKDGMKQTISMRSDFYKSFMDEGEILGHDVNSLGGNDDDQTLIESDEDWEFDDDDDEDSKYEGGFVADSNNNAHVGLTVFGSNSMWIFGYTADEDFSGMYPTNMCAYNIFAVALYGKIYILGAEKRLHYSEDAGTEFNEDIISDNYSFFAQKWIDAPPFEDLLEIVQQEMNLEKFW